MCISLSAFPGFNGSGVIFHSSPMMSGVFPYVPSQKETDWKINGVFFVCVCVTGWILGEEDQYCLVLALWFCPLFLLSWSHSMQSQDTHFVINQVNGKRLAKVFPWHISFHRPLRSREQRGPAEAYHMAPALLGPATSCIKPHGFASPSTESEALFAYDSVCRMSLTLQHRKWGWLGCNQKSLTGKC